MNCSTVQMDELDLNRVHIATQITRFKILEILANAKEGDLNNVNQLSSQLDIKYRAMVFHLRELQQVGLIEGKEVINEPVRVKTICYFLTKKGKEIFSMLNKD